MESCIVGSQVWETTSTMHYPSNSLVLFLDGRLENAMFASKLPRSSIIKDVVRLLQWKTPSHWYCFYPWVLTNNVSCCLGPTSKQLSRSRTPPYLYGLDTEGFNNFSVPKRKASGKELPVCGWIRHYKVFGVLPDAIAIRSPLNQMPGFLL